MSTNFEDLIIRDTRANQPAAGIPGRVYYVTDEGVTERDNGATWQDISDSGSGTIGGSTGATDNAIIRADGTGGATVQNSAATIDDSGTVNIPTGQTYNINGTPHTHAGGGGGDDFLVVQVFS